MKKVVGVLAFLLAFSPFVASAAVLASQLELSAIEFKQGHAPVAISGPSETNPNQTELYNLSGTARSVRISYDILSGPGWRAVEFILRECPTAASIDGFVACRYIASQDPAYGWDGTYIYMPDPNGQELVIDFTKAGDVQVQGEQFTDGIPLNPTRSYKILIYMSNNQYTAAVYGKDGQNGFEAYFTIEDTVGMPTVSTSTPHAATGKTYGSLNGDHSYQRQPLYTTFQNLGNGSFAEGNVVTGMDVRIGSHINNKIYALIREYIPEIGGVAVDHRATAQLTKSGDTTYHFDLLEPFTPLPHRCYQIIMGQSYNATNTTTFYGHTSDVYQADFSGCTSGYNSDDRSAIESPSFREAGVIDHTFIIHTNGSTTPATTTPEVCSENCNSNVMFLPGVGGSRLYRPARADEAPLTEVRMWEPRDNVDVINLGLNEQGKQEITSPQSEIYTRDVLDEAYVSIGGPNIYKSFLQWRILKLKAKLRILLLFLTTGDCRLKIF